jgi:hypothetical protein
VQRTDTSHAWTAATLLVFAVMLCLKLSTVFVRAPSIAVTYSAVHFLLGANVSHHGDVALVLEIVAVYFIQIQGALSRVIRHFCGDRIRYSLSGSS